MTDNAWAYRYSLRPVVVDLGVRLEHYNTRRRPQRTRRTPTRQPTVTNATTEYT